MNKRYWLKGAMIAVIIHIVLSLIILSITGLNPIGNKDLIGLAFPNVFLGVPMYWLFGIPIAWIMNILGNDFFGRWSMLWWLLLYWFAVGALIGWIYGKIKNRKVSIQ